MGFFFKNNYFKITGSENFPGSMNLATIAKAPLSRSKNIPSERIKKKLARFFEIFLCDHFEYRKFIT